MRRLAVIAAALVTLTGCTQAQIDAWLEWHRDDPVAAQAHLRRPEVQAQLAHHVTPQAYSSTSSSGRCVGMEGLLARYSPGWDVVRMSRIMYRESRCTPSASNSCCSGLLQIHQMHIGWMGSCGVHTRSDLYNAERNICAAAMLYRRAGGYSPWTL